jgi:dienelactone hydrolase
MRSIWKAVDAMAEAEVRRAVADRQGLLRREVEDFLRTECEALPQRRAELWKWDYSSVEAFLDSVRENRERWSRAVGVGPFSRPEQPLCPEFAPFFETDTIVAQWLSLPFLGQYRARAVLAIPKRGNPPFPLVVAQHGIGSSPERVFGFDDPENIYHAYSRRLVEAGFAVLAPLNVTEARPRARLQRMCLMLGGTLFGLEIRRTARLLDYVQSRPDIDAGRMGMWGISLGGAYVMFTMPLEPRLRAGVTTAWFNRRVAKMVVDDPRYSCFLSADEEHVFIPGWLREFADSDLASLICPRPLQIQTGKCDSIAWWPLVLQEYEEAAEHYRRLGLAERIELDLHEGGHEADVEAGISFLRRWLLEESW